MEDPGTVVWLPGTGWSGADEDAACAQAYGNYYACGSAYQDGGFLVACCPY
jgi:hypothetical protein